MTSDITPFSHLSWRHTQQSQLCNDCASIPFHLLFRRGPPEFRRSISENRADREALERTIGAYVWGPAGDIRSRRNKCALCRVVANALDRHQRSDLDVCFAQCRAVCGYILYPKYGLPQGWTGRMCVFTGSSGAAFKDDPLARANVLGILEFQHCASPVPTVCGIAETSRYRFNNDPYAQMLARPPDIHKDQRLGGRLLDQDKVSISLLISWIKTCSTHDQQTCGSSAMGISPETTITFLIDVVRSCVVPATPNSSYLALSYCWGNTLSLKHTTTNSAKMQTPGYLDSKQVSLTVHDAMLLTKELGYRHLWVDALCIVQDDAISAQQQIRHMDRIYSAATLTIIAAAGEGSSAGLPGVRPGSRKVQQEVLHLACGPMVTVVDGPPKYGTLRDSQWVNRAWTMQERILSPRKLIFTDTQVFWECQEGIFMEEMVLEGSLAQEFLSEPVASTGDKAGVVQNLDRLAKSALRPNYCGLVQEYTRRQMKYRSDALNAFAGILSAMKSAAPATNRRLLGSAVDFFWGLPKDIFNRALSWEWESSSKDGATCTVYDSTGAQHTLPFPSWSWAAWVGDKAGGKVKWFEDIDASHLVMPEIEFYLEGVNRRLRSINEPRADPITTGQFYIGGGIDRRNRWNPLPSGLSDACFEPEDNFISNGKLHFKTSVATLRIYRLDTASDSSPSETPRKAFDAGPLNLGKQFKDIVRIRLNSPDALCWQDAHNSSSFWPSKRVMDPPKEPLTAQEQFRRANASIPWIQEMFDMVELTNPAHKVPSFDWNSELDDIKAPGQRRTARADFVVIGRSVKDPKHYLRALIVQWSEGIFYRIGCAWISEEDWGNLENREWKKVVLG